MKERPGDGLPEEDPRWHLPGEPFPGARFLKGDSPAKVLEGLQEGDPLALQVRCENALGHRGFLLAFETVLGRVYALTAYHSFDYRGHPPLTEWLSSLIDTALSQLLERQSGEELASDPVSESEDLDFYEAISRATLLPLEGTRRACLALNALDQDTRLAFWDVVVLKRTVEQCAEETSLPKEVVQTRVRDALKAVSAALRPESDLDEFLRGKGGPQ